MNTAELDGLFESLVKGSEPEVRLAAQRLASVKSPEVHTRLATEAAASDRFMIAVIVAMALLHHGEPDLRNEKLFTMLDHTLDDQLSVSRLLTKRLEGHQIPENEIGATQAKKDVDAYIKIRDFSDNYPKDGYAYKEAEKLCLKAIPILRRYIETTLRKMELRATPSI